MHWLSFWELLFNASKNVQENIRPFFGSVWNSFYSSQIQFLLYFELQWLTTNLTSILSFNSKESPKISQTLQLHTSKALPPTNPILSLHFPKVWRKCCLNKLAYPKHLRIPLVITMIYLALIRWQVCAHYVPRVTDVSSASSHLRRWVTLTLQLGKWKLRDTELRPQEGVGQKLKSRSCSKASALISITTEPPGQNATRTKGET